MKREWNPINGSETLVTQMLEGITYIQFTQAPISDTDIVAIAVGIIMECGLLAKAYIKWHERTDAAEHG